MRTIRFYKVDDRAWISPTRYLSAVLSGDAITAVDHGETNDGMRAVAILQAWSIILAMVRAGLWTAFGGLLYATTLVLSLLYPPLMDKLPSGIHAVLVMLLLCVIGTIIWNIIRIIIIRISLAWKKDRVEFQVRNGPPLDPPLIAHKPMEFAKPSVSFPLMLLVVILLLNSVIVATPLRPAIVGDTMYHGISLVRPGTHWRAVQRYPTDEAFHYFYYDGANLTGVYVSYSVEQVDLFLPTPNFRSWMQSYVSSIVNRASNQVAVSFFPNMTDEERLNAYIEFWSDPTTAAQLTLILTTGFNSVYDKILGMRGIDVSVRTISVTQYRSMISADE